MSPGLMAADVTSVVSFEDVSKVYGKVRAVDRLSLELWPGQTVAFLGPNGAGNRHRWTCCWRCASRPAARSACSVPTRTMRSSPGGSARCCSPAD